MGYLLKEALKTLCGVNQWSYAVFWKIGCKNPRLLIWEDYYCEAALFSEAASQDYGSWTSADRAHLLVSKMMMDNHVNIVGEGLVGRVAFTGNYQWILSDSYFIEAHPPAVLKELGQQFAAGMQTVAVVPVFPHGVVQFGSHKKIMENMGFVNDVMSLMLQLAQLPGVFQSENYAEKELAPRIGVPIHVGSSIPGNPLLQSNIVNSSCLFDNLQSSVATFQTPNTGLNHLKPNETKMGSVLKSDFLPPPQFMNRVAKAEVIPSNSKIWTKQHASAYSHKPNHSNFSNSNTTNSDYVASKRYVSGEHKNGSLSPMEDLTPESIEGSFASSTLTCSFGNKTRQMHKKHPESEPRSYLPSFVENEKKQLSGNQIHTVNSTSHDDSRVKPQSGDDLFDVLGADLKNKLFSNCWSSALSNESAQLNWDDGGFTDNLLDAVVSKVLLPAKQNLDDEISCKTTMSYSSGPTTSLPLSRFGVSELAKGESSTVPKSKVLSPAKQNLDDEISCKTTMSYSSGPTTSLPLSRIGVSELEKGESSTVPKPIENGGMSFDSMMSGLYKDDLRTYSQSSSVYGSQVSSLGGNGESAVLSAVLNNSVSNGYSKKQDGIGKTNRKRLKPGENPRPRPKDRQMIQDRVKELREIVPNGEKCSIDALLERTIKHMLFLQGVTKHADKLKQVGQSKIMSKNGGLLLKEDFEGGATWAYEVGSQSVVCPIIVENLNQPRQMLIEMLFEERSLFLEIADIIRGLGLTILKGVMETRNDKIWARFIVEANREVTRMEIFLSLVRLVEQTAKPGVSQPNGVAGENNMIVQQISSN